MTDNEAWYCVCFDQLHYLHGIQNSFPDHSLVLDVSMQYDSEIRPNSKKNGSDKTNKFL